MYTVRENKFNFKGIEKIKQFVEERLKWNEDMKKIDPRASDIGRIEEDKCILRYIEKL